MLRRICKSVKSYEYNPETNVYKMCFLDTTHFPLPLQVQWIGKDKWQLIAPFEYHRDTGDVIRAEEVGLDGRPFITDFGTKPWWCWWFMGSPTDEGGPAYIIHDWMCKFAKWSREKTDFLFLEMLKILKVIEWKCYAMYYAVRLWFYVKP